jgi:hypothetical protein
MLLYWDEVGAIVPYDFIENPGLLDRHTRSLVKANLVRQVIPGRYLDQIPAFKESFVDYLESLGGSLEERRKSFRTRGRSFRIHMEKMDGLESTLTNMGLARSSQYPWFQVEIETAKEFMAYLAATLGQVEELQLMPVTDDIEHLQEFISFSSPELMPEKEIAPLRLEILEDLFPAPSRPLDASEIENFKRRHSDELAEFRRTVERELISLADISDENLRKRRIELFKEESQEAVEKLKDYMCSCTVYFH